MTRIDESCRLRDVNSLRTILGTLYILLMVLIPWLHMPWHGHETKAQIDTHHACGHHHDHQEEEPTDSDPCGLCNLVVVPVELPEILLAPRAIFTFSEPPSFRHENSTPVFQQLHQARAPPALTV